MFKPQTTNERPALDLAIDKILLEMENHNPDSDEYKLLLDHLNKLYKHRIPNQERKLVDPNTMIVAGVNLAGILLVLNFERLGVISSKAFGLIVKSKL